MNRQQNGSTCIDIVAFSHAVGSDNTCYKYRHILFNLCRLRTSYRGSTMTSSAASSSSTADTRTSTTAATSWYVLAIDLLNYCSSYVPDLKGPTGHLVIESTVCPYVRLFMCLSVRYSFPQRFLYFDFGAFVFNKPMSSSRQHKVRLGGG